MVKERLLAPAMLAYAVSFGLVAVSGEGGVSVPGLACAYYSLVSPLVALTSSSRDHMYYLVAWLISGWINIVFLAALAMRSQTPSRNSH